MIVSAPPPHVVNPIEYQVCSFDYPHAWNVRRMVINIATPAEMICDCQTHWRSTFRPNLALIKFLVHAHKLASHRSARNTFWVSFSHNIFIRREDCSEWQTRFSYFLFKSGVLKWDWSKRLFLQTTQHQSASRHYVLVQVQASGFHRIIGFTFKST